MPLNGTSSANVPFTVPSALAPLSPLMKMMSVLSSLPRSCTAWTTRPISWSVYMRYAGVDVGLSDEQFLFIGRQRVPFLQQIVGPGRQLGVLRDDAESSFDWRRSDPSPHSSLVEQVHVGRCLDPFGS